MTSAVLFLLGAVVLIALGSLLVWFVSRVETRSARGRDVGRDLRAALPRREYEPPSGVTLLPPDERDD